MTTPTAESLEAARGFVTAGNYIPGEQGALRLARLLDSREAPLRAEIERLKAQVNALSYLAGRRDLFQSERSFTNGWRAGVAAAFELLGERKDERVMVLNQRAFSAERASMFRYDDALRAEIEKLVAERERAIQRGVEWEDKMRERAEAAEERVKALEAELYKKS